MCPIHRLYVPCLLCALWLAVAASPAAAGPISGLVVFGDSLSDVGNISQATFGIQPGKYYSSGRFSNGPVYAEGIAAGLALAPLTRSTAGGGDFAYGGAQTSGTGGLEGLFIRDVDEQINSFLSSRTADPDALFIVLAGANDLIGGQTDVNIPVDRIAADISRLADAGARQFLVLNLPPLGLVPRYNGNPTSAATMSTLSNQFNAALDVALDGLAAVSADLTIRRLDIAEVITQVVSAPAAFGMTNVTDSAAPGLKPGDSSYDTSQIVAHPGSYLFWDDLHPTAAAHAMLATQALLALREPGDYNGDGAVDAADYSVWRDSLGQIGPGLMADGDANGAVNDADYDLWRANFGAARPGSGPLTAPPGVPEPAALWLAIAAAAVTVWHSKKNARQRVPGI